MSPKTSFEDHIHLATERTLAALREADIDALVATSSSNIQYLTGYRSWTHPLSVDNQSYVVLSSDGKRILCVPSSDGDFIAMDKYDVDELHTFGTFYVETGTPNANMTKAEARLANLSTSMVNKRTWIEELVAVLDSEQLSSARLAVDQGHLMPSHWRLIEEGLPDADVQDAFMLMLRVRAVKTCYEIEMLRQSSTCTEKAIMDSLAVAANHATDIEIQSAFKKSLIDSGAEHLFSAIGVGTRSCFPNVVPEGTHLERGGLLRYDAGCRFQGFPSDLARNAVIGTAPERVRQIYQAMLNGEEAAIQFMRPGVLASEVFEVAMEATRKSGVSHYRRHHCGHAIGLDIYESPIIRPDDSTPLEAGMTFCIETPYYEVGLGGIQVEDLVVVTEDGSELLTALSRDLFEL